MKNKKIKKIGSGIFVLVVILAMIIGLMPQESVYALEGKTSDNNTTNTYTNSLGGDTSTQYTGRVWTDKTVYDGNATFTGDVNEGSPEGVTIKNDSDFLVAYSALASSQSITGQTQVPVDVVFVIDLSGSMSNANSGMDNGKSRIANTVDAVNNSIDELMAMNPYTRIGVVGYSSTATTLLPLDRYTKNGNNNFLRLNRTTASENHATLTYNAVNSQGETIRANISVSGGTNTQVGMYEGMNLLATETSTTVDIDGKTYQRVPAVVLLSDGAATYSSSSREWWQPDNNNSDGPGNGSYAGNGMKLMMTASYMKEAVNRNYSVSDNSNYATKIYTIGMGITSLTGSDANLANISLNPSAYWDANNTIARTIRDAWSTYKNGGSPSVIVNVEGSGW